jgi:integrase
LRRQRKYFTGDTAAAARAARDAYLAEHGKELPRDHDAGTTVKEYVGRFLAHVKAGTRATTWHSYEHTLRLHVLPRIGSMPIADLTADGAKAMYGALRSSGVSPAMVARCHSVLRTAMNSAVEERVIPANPLASMRRTAPKYQRPKIESPTKEQVDAILEAAHGHRLEAMIILAVTTGMRQGELFALQWGDLDLAAGSIMVQRSAQEIAGDIQFVEPKTAQSRRRIKLSKVAIAALKRRRSLADKEDHDSELVFPSSAGYVLRKSNFQRRNWDPIRKAAGLPDAHFHSLRHAAASLMLLKDVNAKIVSEMLGHIDIRLTLNTYSHVLPGVQNVAADAFDALFGPKKRKARKKAS